MKIAVLKERRADERRVAATPETVKKFIALGADISVEAGAGEAAGIPDSAYSDAGATIARTAGDAAKSADVTLKVRAPLAKGVDGAVVDELSVLQSGTILIGLLDPYSDAERLTAYADAGISAFSMELVPRITRAQSMDVLSSQANLAGYKAVLEAANISKAFPLMMTAAGTVAPARVFVLGAGVAGLQAIATAKRLGAVVSATDVRPAAKEQVQSLGGTFVMVDSAETREAETAGGYAKEMSDDYKKQQAALVRETLKKQDVVITTALIPGRKAPILIAADMVAEMKPGAVIVDLAVDQGGNVEGAKAGEVVTTKNGVLIVGHRNMPARIASDTSALYARNLLNFLTPLIDKDSKTLSIDPEEQIVAATCLTRDGEVVHESFATPAKPAKAVEKPADKVAEKVASPAATTAAKPAAKPRKPAAKKAPAKSSATATAKRTPAKSAGTKKATVKKSTAKSAATKSGAAKSTGSKTGAAEPAGAKDTAKSATADAKPSGGAAASPDQTASDTDKSTDAEDAKSEG